MSPIPSVVTAFAPFATTSSVSLGLDSAGKSTSAMSQHLLATGGFFLAVAAIVSVAGYFYHGRGSTNGAGRNNTWASWSNFLSSIRHRGATGTSASATNDGRADLEAGFEQHVSMVYARFFHPTFWNVIECHPATASAPAICVEDEAKEAPVPEQKPYGTNSFLDMDDGDGDGNAKGVQKTTTVNQGAKPNPEQGPPYDTSAGTSMSFSSEVIGATMRAGEFLFVPGQCDNPSETLSTPTGPDSKFACPPCDRILVAPPGSSDDTYALDSPYDGIVTTPPGSFDNVLDTSHDSEWELSCLAYYGIETTSSSDLESTCSSYDGVSMTPSRPFDDVPSSPELEPVCSPYDGILTTPPSSSNDSSETLCNPESVMVYSPRDEISTKPPKSTSSPRRYGIADMQELAQTLKLAIPESGYDLGRTISFRSGLCDVPDFIDVDSAIPRRALVVPNPEENEGTSSTCDGDGYVHDRRDNIRDDSSDDNTTMAAPREGLDLMRKLLEELRDFSVDCNPRALSEDTNSRYSEDEEDKESVASPTPTLETQLSPQLTDSALRTDGDLSDEGPLCPLTPPSGNEGVFKVRMRSPVTWFNERMQVTIVSPPSKAYVRARIDGRILVRGRTWLPHLT